MSIDQRVIMPCFDLVSNRSYCGFLWACLSGERARLGDGRGSFNPKITRLGRLPPRSLGVCKTELTISIPFRYSYDSPARLDDVGQKTTI